MTVLQFPAHTHADIPKDHITSADLMNRTGLTYRKLDHWTRLGLLRPSTSPSPGTGFLRCYPATELAVALLMRQLMDGGVTLRAAHDHARRLLATGTTRLAGITIHLPQDL